MQYLWIQSKIKDGDLKLQKVLGTINVADAMTKAVDRWALDKCTAAVEFHVDAKSRRTKHLALSSLAHLHERPRFHLDRGGCEDPAPALAYWRDALSPEAMTRMR